MPSTLHTTRWHALCEEYEDGGRNALGGGVSARFSRSPPHLWPSPGKQERFAIGADENMDDPAVRRDDANELIPTVLVVEDEPVIRELMAILLEEEGYTVRQAVDGMQALEMLEQRGIDLVLSDVKMPRLDGASMVQRLRSRGDAIPVVLMSAVYAEVDLPGVRFLRKPVNCEHLIDIIATALSANGRSVPAAALDDQLGSAPLIG
jgi:CheY-like chemotaxis protein